MSRPIIELLLKHRNGLSQTRIARELRLLPADSKRLKDRLVRLENRGVIIKLRKKYFAVPSSKFVRGAYSPSHRGYGFVIPQDEFLEDIFIPSRYSGGALRGDIVEVFVKRGRKGKSEGKVIKILKKKKSFLLGIYHKKNQREDFTSLEPDFQEEILLPAEQKIRPDSGMAVAISRDSHHIKKVYGFPEDPGVDTNIIIDKYGLRSDFSSHVQKEAENIPMSFPEHEIKDRVDYRDWTTVTIDGLDAKDFDDAVSIKKTGDSNYCLGVHIADVSYYVQPNTAIDQEAFLRGTSVYFPDSVLPMIPEKLSNVICSLRPGEEKLTVSVLMEFGKEGNLIKSDINLSVIKTKERLTYDTVLRILEGEEEKIKHHSSIVHDLRLMAELASLLGEARRKNGSLDFNLDEPELVYEKGTLVRIVPSGQNEAHRIIEEFMVAANVVVAEFLSSKDRSMIFRVHPQPVREKIAGLKKKLSFFNLTLPHPEKLTSRDLQQILQNTAGKAIDKYIIKQILRSLELAVYSDQNRGHYGLAKHKYTHFTSPIRRYPDLIVHRILKRACNEEKEYDVPLGTVAKRCSEQERKAEEAERDLLDWRIHRYLRTKLGETMKGVVIEFVRSGLIIQLEDYFLEGFVSFLDLGGDYFYKKSESVLVGKRTGKKFFLGESVDVLLASVDPVKRRIGLLFKPG
jgi:ribonuclease R